MRNIIYGLLFISGWLFSVLVPPPGFLRRKVNSWFHAGSSYVDEKESEIKNTLRQEVREGAEKINEKLGN